MSQDRLLSTYLNDHLAGSLAAVELARRARSSNLDNHWGSELDALITELEADRRSLQNLLSQLEFGRDPVKLTAAWSAEKLGRLKLNGRLFGYSPLSRLEELELLLLGVEGKLLLWQALQELPGLPQLEPPLPDLIARGRSQRSVLRRLRRQAAKTAFGPPAR